MCSATITPFLRSALRSKYIAVVGLFVHPPLLSLNTDIVALDPNDYLLLYKKLEYNKINVIRGILAVYV